MRDITPTPCLQPLFLKCRVHISDYIIMGIPQLMRKLDKHNSGSEEGVVLLGTVSKALLESLKRLEPSIHSLVFAAKCTHSPSVLATGCIVWGPTRTIPSVSSVGHYLFKLGEFLLQLVSENS